jgi:ribose 5-phosphate isomerase B
MKIFLGTDHNGFHIKNSIRDYLKRAGYDVTDDSDARLDPEDDFPVFAARVAKDVLGSEDNEAMGILLCGSGQGMCMAANRYRGIRACLGYDITSIRSSRVDDDANVLCIPADTVDKDHLNVLVETFLNTKFAAAPRFSRRIQEMDQLT